jgi:hypothetical protein
MTLLWSIGILIAVNAATIAAMLLVRRGAPDLRVWKRATAQG